MASGNPSKSNSNHFLPSDKISRVFKKKIDSDTIKGIQSFAEKMVQDIINRSTLLAQHADSDVIDALEICTVIDKNFDETFGIKADIPEIKTPLDEHVEK